MPYSYTVSTASAGQHVVAVSFGYRNDQSTVHVQIDGVELTQSALVWPTDSTIDIATANGGNLTAGQEVRVYRETPADNPAVNFVAGSIKHSDLNTGILQLLYIVQEAYDLALIGEALLPTVEADAAATHDALTTVTAMAAQVSTWNDAVNTAQALVASYVASISGDVTTAGASATAAAASATAAAASAASASTHDTAVAASAATATTEATSAAASAYDAAVSATSAASSASDADAAAAAAIAAAGIYETFPQQVLDGATTTTPSGGYYIPLVLDNSPSAATSKKETFTNFVASVVAALTGVELTANKNANNGYAGLDSGGKVAAAQLPSYVDDVLEYANLAAFPGTGATGIIYVADDTNKTYRWSGSAYVNIAASPGSTDSVTEGSTNLYFTVARVLATALTSLSTATATAVVATDTVLAGIGKLQGQINTLLLKLAGNQTITGGFDQTPTALTWANHTVAPKTNNMQYASNTAAITITAPATDCCVIYEVTNGTGAGAVTFSGFSVGSNTGDAFDTTSAHKFFLVMLRINSVATYRWVACQ